MFFVLVLFWIILNGKITTEIVLIGMIVAGAVYGLLYKFLGLTFQKEKKFWKKFLWILEFFVILLREVVLANIGVLKIVLNPKKTIHPVLVSFPSPLKSEALKVLLADSITLTPGTITVRLNEEGFVVHCLDASMAHGIHDSIFVKHLKKWEE